MKNLYILVGISLVAAMAVPVHAQQSQSQGYLYNENATALNVAAPDSAPLTVPQTSTEYAVAAAIRSEGVHAGVEMKDTKEVSTASTASGMGDGFSAPTAYSEYKFAHVQDNRPTSSGGFDGANNTGIVGFDFDSFYNTIVGFSFTYTNSNLSTADNTSVLNNSSNSYFFSTYVAKNFYDWINVGGSGTYGRTDSAFRLDGIGGFTQGTTQDTGALSPFLGVSHTWGAFSFSSTPSYIWGYDHFSFDASPGTLAPGDAKTLNQTFLWLNNFQYAVTDKLSLSVQANWTRLITTQSVPVGAGLPTPDFSHQWMTFGGRADYSFNKDGTVFAAFEHDAFATHYDDYRIRTGVTYNF
jgi:hypothetical protein